MSTMERIESVIFDWGCVLIDDPAPGRLIYCAESLGLAEEILAKAMGGFIVDFQKGLIAEAVFWKWVCEELSVPVPESRSLWTDGFSAAYVAREEVFSLAGSLRDAGYKTAILSNTEVPAMEYFHRQQYDMFDVLVFSCTEGTRKPERSIYEAALRKLGLQPRQCVFIDDDPAYIEGAAQIGLNTILFNEPGQVREELERLGVAAD